MATYNGSDKRLQYLFLNGGGGGGGGTDVQANPQGTPTDYLNTIKIASSIYSVEKPADIYSTEERQVGVWIDGRPIYKRTYDLGSDVSVSYNSWTTLSNVIIPNLDFIVKGYGTNVDGTYTPLQTTWVVATHAIQIQTPRNNYNQNVRYFTIFYCKDNDTAGSGIWTPQGSYAHHYSNDEQIVGTWLGETLYEKTISKNNINVGWRNGAGIQIPHGVSNLKESIDLKMNCPALNVCAKDVLCAVSSGLIAFFKVDATNIFCAWGNNFYGATSDRYWHFTIRYTKTS